VYWWPIGPKKASTLLQTQYGQPTYCLNGQSKIASLDSNHKTGSADYESLTFAAFSNLSKWEKIKWLGDIINHT